MTGFGAASARWAGGLLSIELRSVNHRFFEVRARAPGSLGDVSAELEEALRKRLERGRIDASIRIDSDAPSFDRARLGPAIRELAALRDEFAPGEPLPWGLLAAELTQGRATAPTAPSALTEGLRGTLVAAAVEAAEALDAMRREEGAALRLELAKHLEVLGAELDAIEVAVPEVVARHHAKLRERVEALLAGAAGRASPERLEVELAILADRMDVTEELARARSHVILFAQALDAGEPIGRKLDFVTQEMLREANTIGSKVADAHVAHRVIAMKTTVERLREQVQNVL